MSAKKKQYKVSEASLAGGIFPSLDHSRHLARLFFFSGFPYNTIGSLFTGKVDRDLVYELKKRPRHLCLALIYKQYLCQSFTPANPLLYGSIFMSANDILLTWLLNSVQFVSRNSDVIGFVRLSLCGKDEDVKMSALLLPKTRSSLSSNLDDMYYRLPHLQGLNFAETSIVYGSHPKIAIVIVSDYHFEILTGEIGRGVTGPVYSKFRWVMSGPTKNIVS